MVAMPKRNTRSAKSVDQNKLNQFVGQMLSDLGGASSIALVRMGDALGLYKTLHAKGPMTCAELGKTATVNERYLREWLSQPAASNHLTVAPSSRKSSLSAQLAVVFTSEDRPVYMTGCFDLMPSLLHSHPKVQ